MNLKQLQYKTDTIFINSKNRETSDPHRLILNLTDKINLKMWEICSFFKS